ncbi:MAG: 2-oxoglutarate dehydrogenase complex dihydrolipoyllysine-residue succinyltransferase [Alphaproteobacteria bacterium]|nr:2-oxoglutarate dehydrogenase complex dihydrolipoyllysine-residue succinyltransferase [Alphaproteobacteria bacterium]
MIDVPIPQIGESITHVFVSRWIVQPGQAVTEGQGILELDSDKASMEVPAPASGVLAETLADEGDEIAIGAVVARIDPSGSVGDAPAAAVEAAPAEAPAAKGATRAGPAARQAANEKGVDLDTVKGTGPRGRVTSKDVEGAGSKPAAAKPAAAKPAAPAATQPSGQIERVPMTPLRRTIARRLVEAQQTAAMLTTFNEVDMSAIFDIRKRYQDRFVEKYGIKLGFMSFFLKAAIEALKEFPAVNAEIDGDDILYKNFYHIGVAVSGPKGLVVPVIRDADRLSFSGTELAIREMAVRARDNKLRLDDFKDGTFTISNGGVFGSMMSTPILNPPQVGILGMHNIVERPVVVDGQIVVRPMMYLALSYDHRIIDGREAVSFLVRIKQCVEDPERILLEV